MDCPGIHPRLEMNIKIENASLLTEDYGKHDNWSVVGKHKMSHDMTKPTKGL